jgi:CRP-like cAMP-binding protein
MSDREIVGFLGTVPLFTGWAEADLTDLANVARRRTRQEGETLWRQGDAALEMAVVVEGRLAATLRGADDRAREIGRAGPGDVVGEIGVLDGGAHSMTVEVTQDATLLIFGKQDIAALLARGHPAAFSLKRRLAQVFAERLRNQLRHLAGTTLEGVLEAPPNAQVQMPADLQECRPPDSAYVRRMASFHEFDPAALWGFLTSGTYARCAAGRTLVTEGSRSPACFLTINGAVEKVMIRGDRRIRVALAGPGKAFGYEGLIDGRPSPITAITRERVLLLVLPADPFRQLFNSEDAVSRVFLDVIQRDMVATLRQTLNPFARRPWPRDTEEGLSLRPTNVDA